jgi:hypothetical protein
MRVLPWVRRVRTRRIVDAFGKETPDLVYALGTDAWSVALDTARAMRRPIALDIHATRQTRRLARGSLTQQVAAFLVPTPALADAARARVPGELVSLVPMGVEFPDEPRAVLRDDEQTIGLAIVGSGRDVPAYRAMLEGLADVAGGRHPFLAFLELRGPRAHDVWREAGRLDLLHDISGLGDADAFRRLLSRCDALLLPEPLDEARSIVLEAMARGTVVVTVPQTMYDVLEPGRTSLAVEPTAEAWAEAVRRLLDDRGTARALGLAGREAVADRHTAAGHLEALARTFERILHGEVYPFDPPGPEGG